MSNTVNPYTPQQIADVAIALAIKGSPLASVVKRFGPAEFLGEGRGRTVYLAAPGALTAHARTLDDVSTAIVMDSIQEHQEPVSLDIHGYSAVGLSEFDLSLGIEDFAKSVLAPQVDAVIDRAESAIAAALADVQPTAATYSATDPIRIFTQGRKALRDRGIDLGASDLVAIVGSSIVDDLLDSGALDFSQTGDADALRDGSIGRLRGFRVLQSGRVDDDSIVFMTGESVYLAERAPAVPQGASFGAVSTKDGHSYRYIRDYDVLHTQDRSLVSTFIGAGRLPLYRVDRVEDVKVQGETGFVAGQASVQEVAGGSVVKFVTA